MREGKGYNFRDKPIENAVSKNEVSPLVLLDHPPTKDTWNICLLKKIWLDSLQGKTVGQEASQRSVVEDWRTTQMDRSGTIRAKRIKIQGTKFAPFLTASSGEPEVRFKGHRSKNESPRKASADRDSNKKSALVSQ